MKELVKIHAKQMVRFMIVGGIASGIDFVVYFLLLLIPGVPTSPAKAFSFICGAMISFIGHRGFVFKAQDRAAKKQLLPFAALYGSALLVNNLANELVLYLFPIRVLAWFLATAASTVWNYLGMKFIVFKKSTI